MNYYNEHDPKAAAWLRELINAGLIPNGDVDERSIAEVQPDELRQYTQCHFFAGIGGWSLALQLAGVPDTTRLWTGSCPCQPFSAAGKVLGDKDERHLWPVFFNLIKECRPNAVFGEQVASAIGKGWLDGIQADLESEGYACGSVVLGAHSVRSPHIRQRLYWVADSDSGRCEQRWRESVQSQFQLAERGGFWGEYFHRCQDGKSRRISTESALFPLANGISNSVGILRGAGNAIVPQVAAEFIKAFLESQTACLAVNAKIAFFAARQPRGNGWIKCYNHELKSKNAPAFEDAA